MTRLLGLALDETRAAWRIRIRPPAHWYDGKAVRAEWDVIECATVLPKAICAICRRLFHEAGASLQWHANAFGRAVCRHCRN
jgi:hypothetical protein